MPMRSTQRNTVITEHDLESQIKRMVAFVEHETKERVEEIDSKTDGEFCYEKGRLIQSARQDLQRVYEKKEKLMSKQVQADTATLQNQARLRELACREAHIARVEAEVQKRLVNDIKDRDLYKSLLMQMILQGLYKLLERKVVLRVREEDRSLVEGLMESARQQYLEHIGDVKLILDTSKWLTPACLGGVELATPDRRVRITNTLHGRLQMIVRQLVPLIRQHLFGEFNVQQSGKF